MCEIYKNENSNLYEVLHSLENSLNIENKMDVFFNNFQLLTKFMNVNIVSEILLLSSFVRKNIYAMQLYVLKDSFESNNLYEVNNILSIVNLILKSQEYYIDFIYNRCINNKLEHFDIKKVEEYQNDIEKEIKKLELKNN